MQHVHATCATKTSCGLDHCATHVAFCTHACVQNTLHVVHRQRVQHATCATKKHTKKQVASNIHYTLHNINTGALVNVNACMHRYDLLLSVAKS